MTDLERINGVPVRMVDDATKARIGWPYDVKTPTPYMDVTTVATVQYQPHKKPLRERAWDWLGNALIGVGCWCRGIDPDDLYL